MGEKSALKKGEYLKELDRLTVELVKLQEWVKFKGLKMVAVFEGRDAAGKGGVIKAITAGLNPRNARIAALATPTEKEKSQWYFQRYVAQLPSAGEMVFFDRSWYNRAGVERVMGFCTDAEFQEFKRSAPEFERMLVRSGIVLVKYWLSVSDEVQESRFKDRLSDPAKRWKLSPMDMSARSNWVEYSKAKDEMFQFSDLPDSPWHVIDANDKYCARLNAIAHFLALVPYKDRTPEKIELPERQKAGKYERPPIQTNHWIQAIYPAKIKPIQPVPVQGAVDQTPSDGFGVALSAPDPENEGPKKKKKGKKKEKK